MANCTSGKRLTGKVVFITGAAQGIGKATALKCLSEGAEVIATDMNAEKLKELKTEVPDVTIDTLDVTKGTEVERVMKLYNNFNVLFNCAGYVFNGTIQDTSEADWDRSFNINVKSMYYTTKTAVDIWREKKVKGSIINMGSVASSIKGAPNRCVYGATKAAVMGLTKAVAADYVSEGIRCNAICPGTIDTPSLSDRMRALGDYDTARGNFIARQKMGRLGTADEVACLVVYLASEESAFVTGGFHVIDGGWSL